MLMSPVIDSAKSREEYIDDIKAKKVITIWECWALSDREQERKRERGR